MSDTKELILHAARDLFSEKGYAASTTREIAAKAGVSEVTLFRHFESKRNLFKRTFRHFMNHYSFKNFFEQELSYDLHTDLTRLADLLHDAIRQNAPLIKMLHKDISVDPKLRDEISLKDERFNDSMEQYFTQMHQMGKLNSNPKNAYLFFVTNINGYMMHKFVFEKDIFPDDYYDWIVSKTIETISPKPFSVTPDDCQKK